MSRLIFGILTFFMAISVVFAADTHQEEFNFFNNSKTFIQNPFKLRDPFKRKREKRSVNKKKKFSSFIKGNTFSNIPTIENVPLEKIKIVGVLLGKKRRAIAKISTGKGNSGTTYLLKEGMKLGTEEAELKAILPGGIVIVEKIRNVYDQDEYLETVIPIQDD